jgi:hypothetical protein
MKILIAAVLSLPVAVFCALADIPTYCYESGGSNYCDYGADYEGPYRQRDVSKEDDKCSRSTAIATGRGHINE